MAALMAVLQEQLITVVAVALTFVLGKIVFMLVLLWQVVAALMVLHLKPVVMVAVKLAERLPTVMVLVAVLVHKRLVVLAGQVTAVRSV